MKLKPQQSKMVPQYYCLERFCSAYIPVIKPQPSAFCGQIGCKSARVRMTFPGVQRWSRAEVLRRWRRR
ncbi:MAG: hypothetical protein WC325_10195 [Candidatus Bathyarchaeia archaeon]